MTTLTPMNDDMLQGATAEQRSIVKHFREQLASAEKTLAEMEAEGKRREEEKRKSYGEKAAEKFVAQDGANLRLGYRDNSGHQIVTRSGLDCGSYVLLARSWFAAHLDAARRAAFAEAAAVADGCRDDAQFVMNLASGAAGSVPSKMVNQTAVKIGARIRELR